MWWHEANSMPFVEVYVGRNNITLSRCGYMLRENAFRYLEKIFIMLLLLYGVCLWLSYHANDDDSESIIIWPIFGNKYRFVVCGCINVCGIQQCSFYCELWYDQTSVGSVPTAFEPR